MKSSWTSSRYLYIYIYQLLDFQVVQILSLKSQSSDIKSTYSIAKQFLQKASEDKHILLVVWQKKQEKYFLYKVVLNNHNILAFNLIILSQAIFHIFFFFLLLYHFLFIVCNENKKQGFEPALLRPVDCHCSTYVNCGDWYEICYFIYFFNEKISWGTKHICHISFYLNTLSHFLL